MSKRVQMRRSKGWRMPPNTVYVGRPSRWGNPYRHADYVAVGWGPDDNIPMLMVSDFRSGAIERTFIVDLPDYPSKDEIKAALHGKDLACWCPLDQPCHADVLLDLLADV